MAVSYEAVKSITSLREYAKDYLQPAGHSFVCPCCGSGLGPHRTPALSIKGNGWHCFSCGAGGDVFDLAGIVLGTENRKEQLLAVAEWAGIATETASVASRPYAHATRHTMARKGVEAATAPQKDYTEGQKRERAYIAEARTHIGDTEVVEYLRLRGITEGEATEAGLGYDPAKKRLIIPWEGTDYYHVDRDTTGMASAKYLKPKAEEVGPQPLYNPAALDEAAFFVVEGVLDALAVKRCGLEAVALGSTSDAGRALRAAMLTKAKKPLALILLDRDGAGMRGAEALAKQLREASLPCKVLKFPETVKGNDPDEAARDCLLDLTAWLMAAKNDALESVVKEEEERYSAALKSLRVLDPSDVAGSLYLLENAHEPIPTGFETVDAVLNGGLRRGLYVLGAVSSLGKTTLALQIADTIAAARHPVLFVTIEQAASELVAKSLSRIMQRNSGGNPWMAATATEIADPKSRAGWRDTQNDALLEACNKYAAEVAPRLKLLEGSEQPGVEQIAAVARRMADHDGEPPVIFIDYMQLLKAQSDRDSDKQAVDHNVMALRQLARDLDTPIVAISSLNRSSYNGRISMEAFKESGAIEYGADVLLGLQPKGMPDTEDEKKDKTEAAKAMRHHKGLSKRECELVVLKNRHGMTPEEGAPLMFDAMHALFDEAEKTKDKSKRRVI